MNPLKRLKPKGHPIENRIVSATVGLIVAVIGLYLLWDAFDGRGKKLPWPASGLAPW